MADPEPGPNEEKFVVVPLGRDSKRIGQVIGSESCRKILDSLTSQPASTSQLAERLGLALTTVQYDVERLLEAGLIRVERVARTEKMREMKIYGPVRKLIVVVPEKLAGGSPTDLLKRYLGAFLGILFVGALVELLPAFGGGLGAPPATAPQAMDEAAGAAERSLPLAAPAAAPEPAFLATPPEPHYGLWLIVGGALALALLGLAGWVRRRKKA